MERFYLTVARVAKKTLHHMVEHRIPMLPDIYSRHFYRFLSSLDQELQEIIEEQQLSDHKEVCSQQDQGLVIMKELAVMIDKLDRVTDQHTEQLDNHLLNLKDYDKISDLAQLKKEITEELSRVLNNNNKIHSNITEAQEAVKRLQSKMEEVADMATIDELTGLYNRRALFGRLTEEHSRAERYGQGFSLLLIDIDDFKNVNDEHGHQVGDGILRGFGAFLRHNLRDSDFPARFGGEEFICLLPSTDIDQAVQAANKICQLLTKSTLSSKKIDVTLRITVSIGVAAWTSGDDIDNLIKRADDALFLAKRRGKNQIVTEREL